MRSTAPKKKRDGKMIYLNLKRLGRFSDFSIAHSEGEDLSGTKGPAVRLPIGSTYGNTVTTSCLRRALFIMYGPVCFIRLHVSYLIPLSVISP